MTRAVGREAGAVYGLLDPREHRVRYIGVTYQPPRARLNQHLTAGRRGQHLPVARWVASLLAAGVQPVMMILSRWEPDDRDPYEIEAEMIEQHRARGCDLLNLAPGGKGGGTRPKSPEHRAAISAALRGRPAPERTPEWREAHAAKLRGRKHSPETIARMSIAQRRRFDS